jgi:hypothetical protein
VEQEGLVAILREVVSGRSAAEGLICELRNRPELSDFDDKWQCFGGAAVLATLPRLADWMVERCQIVDAVTVVNDLNRYLCANEIPFREVMVLATVTLKAPISLSCNAELIPFDDLPSSIWKDSIRDQYSSSWLGYRPAVAVQHFVHYRRQHCENPPKNLHEDTTFEFVEDVRLCMTAVGPSAPLSLGSWVQAEDWVPNLANSAMLPEPFNTGYYGRNIIGDWSELPSLHARWVHLGEKEKNHLRVPLARINSALRHPDIVNGAIDLGIAIDSVFSATSGYGPVRLRAARFLRRAERERRQIAETFATLWKMRCDAVHEGRIKSDKGMEQIRDAIYEGCCLVNEAVTKCIREGLPDWDTIFFS